MNNHDVKILLFYSTIVTILYILSIFSILYSVLFSFLSIQLIYKTETKRRLDDLSGLCCCPSLLAFPPKKTLKDCSASNSTPVTLSFLTFVCFCLSFFFHFFSLFPFFASRRSLEVIWIDVPAGIQDSHNFKFARPPLTVSRLFCFSLAFSFAFLLTTTPFNLSPTIYHHPVVFYLSLSF